MLCPICVEQKTVYREYVDERDLTGHLITHIKIELARELANTLFGFGVEVKDAENGKKLD